MPTTNWKHQRATKRRVAQQLSTIVESLEVSRVSIAKAIGCSPSTISVALSGRFGSFEIYDSIAWALGMTLNDLDLRASDLVRARRAA